MTFPDIRDQITFENHIELTAQYLSPDLSVEEIVGGVNRLAKTPEVFGEVEIGGVRRINAIATLIKSSTQSL